MLGFIFADEFTACHRLGGGSPAVPFLPGFGGQVQLESTCSHCYLKLGFIALSTPCTVAESTLKCLEHRMKSFPDAEGSGGFCFSWESLAFGLPRALSLYC
jgi:hypothetical protein